MFSAFAESGTIFSNGKDKLIIGWGQKHFGDFSTSFSDPTFYFPDFFLTAKRAFFTHANHREISVEEMADLLPKFLQTDPIEWTNPYRNFFHAHLKHLSGLFQRKILTKAVPYIFEESGQPFTKEHLAKSLASALKNLKKFHGFLYGTWSNGNGILGITPETLFELKENSVCTHALAGTSPNQKELENSKMMKEHQLVIQGMANALNKFGKLTIGNIELLKLSHFFHLSTPIRVELNREATFLEIVQALHPTPALGAFPLAEGWNWLNAYQKSIERHRFGAPVGLIQKNTAASCHVAIRNIQWFPGKILIGAGCGVVSESKPEEEWEEIKLKIDSIKETLNL